MVLYISNVYFLSIHNILKTISVYMKYGQFYIPNIYMFVLFMPHVEKLSAPHMEKRLLFIWHTDNLSTCGINILMSILGTDKIIIVYTAYGKFFYISYGKIVNTSYEKKRFLSICHIDNVFICGIDKKNVDIR